MNRRRGVTEAGVNRRRGVTEAGVNRRRGVTEAGVNRRRGVTETGVNRRRGVLAVTVAVAVLVPALAPAAARAALGLVPGSFQVETLNEQGQPELRAGAHPDKMIVRFAFTTLPNGGAEGNVKELTINLPAGLVGDPLAVPACPRAAFVENQCEPESQIGVMHATFAGLSQQEFPLYAIEPREGELAEFGFFALVLPIRLEIGLRPQTGYGLQINLHDLPQSIPLTTGEVELWGVPADHQSGTEIPHKALLTNPTSCEGGPPTTGLQANSWQSPEDWIEATSVAPALTGCNALSFAPSLSLALNTPRADSPTGLTIGLSTPQDEEPEGLATSEARALSMTLPAGLTLSPAAAEGLTGCENNQFALGSAAAPACPPASKIGTVAITTALLDAPIDGELYLGSPQPGAPLRVFITASVPGVTLKFMATLSLNPQSGQLSIVLNDMPALPLSNLSLRFEGGPHALLATPPGCGVGAATASVQPTAGGAPAAVAAPIEIAAWSDGAPCPAAAPFAPQLIAGSSQPLAGHASAFSVVVRRADGEQLLERFSVALPPGLSARLASVPLCAAQIAVLAACPASSLVGTVAVEAGAGPNPLPLTGDIYLTGPHAGAPFGLAFELSAPPGPFDLGSVVVLSALNIDPADAHITVTSDPLPQLLGGIPLRLRTFAIDIDREGFMLDPTSCTPSLVTASLTSLESTRASAAVRYAVGGCGRLPFAPKVSLALGPRATLRRGAHPALTIELRSGSGQATVSSARIELPSAVAITRGSVTAFCTRRLAIAGDCPADAAIGTARVRSPLLAQPLAGIVDIVAPASGSQPELWANVAGMGVRLTVHGTISAPPGKPLTTTFVGMPDVPLSLLSITLRGGRGGLLTLAQDLCVGARARRLTADTALLGHNGARRSALVRVAPACRASP
jgi:hypothetical protein